MNKTNITKFEQSNIAKLVLSNAIPAIISMIVVLLYNMADTFFIGQTGNAIQVAAVSLATPVFLLFMAVGTLFGIGGTSVISRAFGREDYKLATQTNSFCFWSSIIVGIIFIILLQVFIDSILSIIGATEATWNYARDYLIYVSWSAPFVIVSTSMSNIIRTEGYANEAMIGVAVGTIINILLDPLLILTFDMGIAGAAWATVIGNILSTIYFIWAFLSKCNNLSLKYRDFKIKWSIMLGVLSIGIPASLNSIMMSISNIVLNVIIVKYGDIVLASMGVSIKILMITTLLQIGLGQGIQPLLGYCYGAKQFDRFNKILCFSNIISLVFGVVLTTICLIFSHQMVLLFIDSQEVAKYGVRFVQIMLTTGPFIGILFIYTNALQAVGASGESLILSISRQGIVFIPCLFILDKLIGLDGITISQPIADVISCLLSLYLFYSYKKHNFLHICKSVQK